MAPKRPPIALARLPGDIGINRISRRSGSGLRRGGRGADGTRDDAIDYFLYGETGYSASSYRASSAPGGEPGVASGFVCAVLFAPQKPPSVTSILTSRYSGTTGYQIYVDNLGDIYAMASNGAGTAFVIAPTHRVISSDVGKVMLAVLYHDGAKVRLFVRRAEQGTGTATTGYTAASAALTLGARAGTFPASDHAILGELAAQGTPSSAQLQALFDATRVNGDLPSAAQAATLLASTITHRWSMKDQLVGTLVVDGQASPANLTDTVTGAAGDALAKVGTGLVVKRIDPTIDGRRTLGVQGFGTKTSNAVNQCLVSTGTGIVGSANFWVAAVVRFDAIPGQASPIAHNANSTASQGWMLQASAASLRFLCGSSSNVYTITAADVGQPLLVVGQLLAGQVYIWIRRVASAASAGSFVSVAGQMYVGAWTGGPQSSPDISVFGLSGGNGAASTAQVQQMFDDFASTGRMPTIPGMTDHRWDFTSAILATGVDAVPATFPNSVGTDNLTRVGIDVRSDANSIRGVGPYGVPDGWQTAPGGGVQGASSGFHVLVDLWLTKLPSAFEIFAGCVDTSLTTGFTVQASSAAILARVFNPNTTSASYTLTSGDLAKRTRVLVVFTGSQLRLYVNSATQVGSDVAMASYVVPTTRGFFVGNVVDAIAARNTGSGYVECVQGGNTVPSGANITALFADLTTAPPTIAGVTLKRHIFETDIAAVSGALPAKSTERISGGDDLVRIGSPLTLAQQTARVWSYETSPILNGFQLPTTFAEGFEASNVQIGNTTQSWWLTLVCAFNVATSGGKRFLHRSTGATGFLALAINGTAWNPQAANASGAMTSGATTIISGSDLGKLAVLSIVYDAPSGKLRVYNKRAENGTGTTLTNGYTPDTGALCWGGIRTGGGSLESDASQFGLCGGNYLPSLAELVAQHDAIMAGDGVIAAIPYKTAHLWNGRRLVGQASPFVQGVTTIPDEIGSSPMVLGNNSGGIATQPARADVYARAFNV